MLSFTVRMTFDQEDRQAITDILLPLTQASRQEPGCVTYIPHFVEGEPCTVFISLGLFRGQTRLTGQIAPYD
jgi:quinol monooxygenase YgiN